MESQIIIPKDKEQAIKGSLATLQAKMETLAVNDEQGLIDASSFLSVVKTHVKRIKFLRDELIAPIKASIRHSENWFKAQSEPFEIMESKVKSMIADYSVRKEAEARVALVASRADASAPIEPVERPRVSVQTEHGKVFTSRVWTFEVEDIAQVPKELLVVNSAEVLKLLRLGVRDIKGIRVFEKTIVTAKA